MVTLQLLFNLNYDNDHIFLSALIFATERSASEEDASQTIPNSKKKHPSHMKALLLIQPSSGILFLPSEVLFQWWHMLQSLGHVSHRHQKSHVEIQKEAGKRSRLLGLGVSRRRGCLTPPSAPPLLKPWDGRSCTAAYSLWLWDNLWELRKCKNLIYSSRLRRS